MDAELGTLLWRSSFVIVPLVFYQCGSTLVTAFRNAGSDFDVRHLNQISSHNLRERGTHFPFAYLGSATS
jgi:hypothetical protein